MSPAELLERGRALLAAEGPLDPARVAELAVQMRSAPPGTREIAGQLLEVIQALSERTRADLKATGAALRRVTKGRRALRGYGSLKGARRAQRANRVA
ncbi:MAG TPA: hypothetical protein ENK18_09245 [Deltaproteobacteria bacterium]|nr:hypothetical protein [Deltaproteobacteria bacterium]